MSGRRALEERLCDIVEQFKLTDEGVKGTKVNKAAELLNVSAILDDERYRKLVQIVRVLYMACPRRTGISSYKIKHTLESLLGEYVSNGWAILAFYHLEFPVTVNTTINASMKVRQHDLNNPIVLKAIRQIINDEEVDVSAVVSTLKYHHLPLAFGEHDRRVRKENGDDAATTTTMDDGATMTTEGDFEAWDMDYSNKNLLKAWNEVQEEE